MANKLGRVLRAEKIAQEQRELVEEQRALAEKRAEDYRRSLYRNHVASADVAAYLGFPQQSILSPSSCPMSPAVYLFGCLSLLSRISAFNLLWFVGFPLRLPGPSFF